MAPADPWACGICGKKGNDGYAASCVVCGCESNRKKKNIAAAIRTKLPVGADTIRASEAVQPAPAQSRNGEKESEEGGTGANQWMGGPSESPTLPAMPQQASSAALAPSSPTAAPAVPMTISCDDVVLCCGLHTMPMLQRIRFSNAHSHASGGIASSSILGGAANHTNHPATTMTLVALLTRAVETMGEVYHRVKLQLSRPFSLTQMVPFELCYILITPNMHKVPPRLTAWHSTARHTTAQHSTA